MIHMYRAGEEGATRGTNSYLHPTTPDRVEVELNHENPTEPTTTAATEGEAAVCAQSLRAGEDDHLE